MFPVSFCSASLLHRDPHCPTITEPSSKVQRRHSQVPVSVIDGDMKPVTDDLGHWVSNRYIRWFIWHPLWSLWFGFVYPFCIWVLVAITSNRLTVFFSHSKSSDESPAANVPSVFQATWKCGRYAATKATLRGKPDITGQPDTVFHSWFSCLRLPPNLA
jgi:hypothetical protein